MVEVGTPGTNGDRHGPKFRTEPAFQFPAVNPSSLQASLCWKTKCCQANNPQHFLQTGIISCCRSVSLPSPLAVLDVHLIHVKLPDTTTPTHLPERTHLANLTVQESHLAIALEDLEKAQCELDAKQAELDTVQMEYEQAMREKQKPTGSSVKIENVNTRECGHGTYPAYGLFVPHPSGGQCVKIREKYGFTHPKRIKQIMLEGGLVPVGIMLDVLKEAMLQNLNETKGFIMDGYPQTLEQADIFDKSVSVEIDYTSSVLPTLLTPTPVLIDPSEPHVKMQS